MRALLLELGCGGGQRQRPGQFFQEKKNPIGKEQRTKKGTNKKATSERERHRPKTITYLFFFPTYLPTYLPTQHIPPSVKGGKEKKRKEIAHATAIITAFAVCLSFLFFLSFFLSMLTRLVQSSFPYLLCLVG